MAEVTPKYNANEERDHLGAEAREQLSKSIWRTSEMPAVVDRILQVTQDPSPKNLEIRHNLVMKLAGIIRQDRPEQYQTYLADLKGFLKQVSTNSLQQHEAQYDKKERGKDPADIAREIRFDLGKFFYDDPRLKQGVFKLLEADKAKIAPLRDKLLQSMQDIGQTENIADPTYNGVGMDISYNMMEFLRTFYNEKSLTARGLAVLGTEFDRLRTKDPEGKNVAAWNTLYDHFQLLKEYPLKYLQAVKPQFKAEMPSFFPEEYISPELLMTYAQQNKWHVDPQWALLYQEAILREEDRILFNKGFREGLAHGAESLVKDTLNFVGGAITFIPQYAYELGALGNDGEAVQEAFAKLVESDNAFAKGIRDSYTMANTISRAWAESVVALGMDGEWKEQFLQDMSEDALVDFCASYVNLETLNNLIKNTPPEQQGAFIGEITTKIAAAMVTQMGTAKFLSQFPHLHKAVDMKAVTQKLGAKLKKDWAIVKEGLEPRYDAIPIELRSRRQMRQTGAINLAPRPRVAVTMQEFGPTPFERAGWVNRDSGNLVDIMESLSKSALKKPILRPELQGSGLKILNQFTVEEERALIIRGAQPKSFEELLNSVANPDKFQADLLRGRWENSRLYHFAKAMNVDPETAREEVVTYLNFVRQKRVKPWVEQINKMQMPSLWKDTNPATMPSMGQLRSIGELKPPKMDELYISQLFEEYCFPPLQQRFNSSTPGRRVLLGGVSDDVKGVDMYLPQGDKYLAIDVTSNEAAAGISGMRGTKELKHQQFADAGLEYKYENLAAYGESTPLLDERGNRFIPNMDGPEPNVEKRVIYLEKTLWHHFRQQLTALLYKNSYYEPGSFKMNRKLVEMAFRNAQNELARVNRNSPILKMSLEQYLYSLLGKTPRR